MGKDSGGYISRVHSFLDENIRYIQYPTYAVGIIGLGLIVKSVYMFSKFTSAKSIPKEFLSKGVCLRGRILDVTCTGKLANTESLSNIHLHLEHIPIASLSLRKQDSKQSSALNVQLAGIRVGSSGFAAIQRLVPSQSAVWFKLYGTDTKNNVIYASVLLKSTWRHLWRSQDLAVVLLKQREATVSPLVQNSSTVFNSDYAAYYRNLLFCESKAREKKRIAWLRHLLAKIRVTQSKAP